MTYLGDLVGPQLRAQDGKDEERDVTATELRDLYGGKNDAEKNRAAAADLKAAGYYSGTIESIKRSLERYQKGERGEAGQTRTPRGEARKLFRVIVKSRKSAFRKRGADIQIKVELTVSGDTRLRTIGQQKSIHIKAKDMAKVLDERDDDHRASALWIAAMQAYGLSDDKGNATGFPANDMTESEDELIGDSAGSVKWIKITPGEATS